MSIKVCITRAVGDGDLHLLPKINLKNGSSIVWQPVELLDFEVKHEEWALIEQAFQACPDWIIFSSKRAFDFLNIVLAEHQFELPLESQLAAMGQVTAMYLEEKGVACDFYPVDAGTQGFIKEFRELIRTNNKKPRIVLVGAELGRSDLVDFLSEEKCEVFRLTPYSTRESETAKAQLKIAPDPDVILFTSPSAVSIYSKYEAVHQNQKLIAIGSFTAKKIEEVFQRPADSLLPQSDLARIGEVL